MPEADCLIRRDAPDAAVRTEEVVMDEPGLKVVFHLLGVSHYETVQTGAAQVRHKRLSGIEQVVQVAALE